MHSPTVAIMMESDFYEHEIWYYHYRFLEAGVEARFVTRLWGNAALTFKGHEYRAPFECREDIESLDLDAIDALIVPSGMVADRLRYTDNLKRLSPATDLLRRAFERPRLIKGIICHGLWLCAPHTEMIRGKRLTCHPNLYGDAIAYGAHYMDEDLVEHGDLVTARTGGHAHLLAQRILARLGA